MKSFPVNVGVTIISSSVYDSDMSSSLNLVSAFIYALMNMQLVKICNCSVDVYFTFIHLWQSCAFACDLLARSIISLWLSIMDQHNAIALRAQRLRVLERVTFGLCDLAYRCLRGTTPMYLAESLLQISDVDIWRRLRSADTAVLVVPSTRRSMLGDRAFPVAAVCAWNSLSSSVRNALSLMTFHRELKTVLFQLWFDDH